MIILQSSGFKKKLKKKNFKKNLKINNWQVRKLVNPGPRRSLLFCEPEVLFRQADVSEPCTMATSGGGCGDDSDIVSRIEELAQENRQLRKGDTTR